MIKKIALLCAVATRAFDAHPETVRIKSGDEYFIINKDDYDEAKHGKLPKQETDAEAPMQPGAVVPPAPGIIVPPSPAAPHFGDNAVAPQTVTDDTIAVDTTGTGKNKKFIAVFAKDASPVKGWRDIDEAGYATEAECWTAILAAKKQPNEQLVQPPQGMPDAAAIEAAKDAVDGKTE